MDVERVEALVKLLHGARASELLVEADGWKVSITKGAPPRVLRGSSSPPRPSPPEAEPVGRVWITAPLVGIFRAGNAHLAVGDTVQRGQTVGHIESMKILNPLTSEVAGEVTAIAVEEGQPVEYGQPLLEIRPEEGG